LLESLTGNIEYSTLIPMMHLSLGYRAPFLQSIVHIGRREKALTKLYERMKECCIEKEVLFDFSDLPKIHIPQKGLYLFFDQNEQSQYASGLPRIVRIGTHGVSQGSKSSLRSRLRAHFGLGSGGGNHRASVFRLHVGNAIIERDNLGSSYQSWAIGQSADRATTSAEFALELQVSSYIRSLKCMVFDINDESSLLSARAAVEKFIITLISENGIILDPPSPSWLGLHSNRSAIRHSGLWNVQHIGAKCEPPAEQLFDSLFAGNSIAIFRDLLGD